MPYVTELELATQIGKPGLATAGNVDPRLTDCVRAAIFGINDTTGRLVDMASDDPRYPIMRRVALSYAVDLWKQPDATFGIMGLGETGPVRVARDLLARYEQELIPCYEPESAWGVA